MIQYNMQNALKTFEVNTKGRDFVIGDLHGAMPCLIKLLEGIEFDESVDRIFSVGDLVDRGPDSLGCLRLVREPWFHPVKANHEQMMLEAFFGGPSGAYWYQNGGAWGIEAFNYHRALQQKKNGTRTDLPTVSEDDLELIDLLQTVNELPYLITVNMADGKKFHIIHAELPPGYVITDSDLSSPGRVLELATEYVGDGDAFLWGRNIFMDFYAKDLSQRDKIIRTLKYSGAADMFNDKLSHIISGHTIMQRPFTVVGQTNIDTCAFRSGGDRNWTALTAVELATWKFYQATPTEFRTVEPVVVNKEDLA